MDPGDSRSQKPVVEQVARREVGIGSGLLGFTIIAVILSFVLLTFGLAPIALLIVALVPVAWIGGWLLRHGTARMRQGRRRVSRIG
jgi:hypothetical protein